MKVAKEERSEAWKEMQAKALSQLKSGKSLYGKDGAFAPLLKEFIDTALEAELDAHLDDGERKAGNRKNGKGTKQVGTSDGEIEISTPRDRTGSFEPELVRKRETILADNLESKIIGMYGLGMSFRDISAHIEEMYDMKISHSTLSEITERIIPMIKEWQGRPFEPLYAICWLDAIHYKVKFENKIVSRAVYNILGVNPDGQKELIGLYTSEQEGARFWLEVLTDLKNRGVQDILICGIDNLTGFAEAIETIFPKTEVQLCIIHQIRNSMKYVASKDQKMFMEDLKPIYKAATKEMAELQLDKVETDWVKKYPKVVESWRRNWDRLSAYFKYTEPIRKLIYTTNAVEGLHRQFRKITKSKGAFPSDMALIKILYLEQLNIAKNWKAPLRNWPETVSQLSIWFADRLKLTLA